MHDKPLWIVFQIHRGIFDEDGHLIKIIPDQETHQVMWPYGHNVDLIVSKSEGRIPQGENDARE